MEENRFMDFIPRMIDLGLPSGTLWADRNVGAAKPEDYGSYFRFGESEPFMEQSPKYKWRVSYDGIEGSDDDAATVHFNRRCHTPSFEQIKELLDSCTHEWTSLNGVSGIRVTGPNGKSIFFPAAGFRSCKSAVLTSNGSYGVYMSSMKYDITKCHGLYFDRDELKCEPLLFPTGHPVRAVARKDAFHDLFKR